MIPRQSRRSAGVLAVLAAALITTGCTKDGSSVATAAESQAPVGAPVTIADDRLPDLVMLPLVEFSLDYDDGGRRILRFSSQVANVGDGPFEVVGSRRDKRTDDLKVVQNLHRANGSVRTVRTDAIMRYTVNDDH